MEDDVINGAWIRARLPGIRGDVARLAQALGISSQDASKILSDTRNVQPKEFLPLLRFLGFTVVEPPSASQAIEEIMTRASDLNETGLSLLQEQIASLQKVPELRRQHSDQSQEQ